MLTAFYASYLDTRRCLLIEYQHSELSIVCFFFLLCVGSCNWPSFPGGASMRWNECFSQTSDYQNKRYPSADAFYASSTLFHVELRHDLFRNSLLICRHEHFIGFKANCAFYPSRVFLRDFSLMFLCGFQQRETSISQT